MAFFAPPDAWTRFPAAAARAYTYWAVRVAPTNEIALIFGWSSRAFTASWAPFTRFITPGGNPACSISSNTRRWTIGSCSDGLRMNVLPVATAYGQNQKAIMNGKLNGVIAAQTPSGW